MSQNENNKIARRIVEETEIDTLRRKLEHERKLKEADYVMEWTKVLPIKPDLKLAEFRLMVEAILEFTGLEATRDNIRNVAGKMVKGFAGK